MESEPITSASPPVAIKGVASDATKSIFFFCAVTAAFSLTVFLTGFGASGLTDAFVAEAVFLVVVFVVLVFFVTVAIIYSPFLLYISEPLLMK